MVDSVANATSTPTIEPNCLAIHLTYRCPLSCAHCCFSSDGYKLGHQDLAQITRLIDEALLLGTIRFVGFTGGDPFLHQDILHEAIRYASQKGLRTRVVTSAYWATSPEKATRTLASLADAGLKEMTVSYDDAHAEFVKAPNIRHAYHTARKLGVFTAVTICLEPECKIDRNVVLDILREDATDPLPLLQVFESRVTSTGRALEGESLNRLNARSNDRDVYRGPCPHVLRQPTVTPTGQIMACCGTLPFRKGLCIGDVKTHSINQAINAAYQDDIMRWLAFEGPVEILKYITSDTDTPFHDRDFDGICHACDVLFSSERLQTLLAEKVLEKKESLRIQAAIYEGVGLLRSPTQ